MKNFNLLKIHNITILFFLVILSSCEAIRDNYYERFGPPYIRSQHRADRLIEKLKKKQNCVYYFCYTYSNSKNVWFQNGDTVYMYKVFPWIIKRKKILTQNRINVDSLNTIPRLSILDGADFYYECPASMSRRRSVNLETLRSNTSKVVVDLKKYLVDLNIISP